MRRSHAPQTYTLNCEEPDYVWDALFLQEFPQCVAEPDATARVGEEVPGHSPDWRARIGDEHRVLEDLILYKVVFAEADVSALDFDRMFRARAVRVGVTVALGASWRCVRGFEADLARKGAGGVGSKVVLINIDSGGSNRHGLRARTENPPAWRRARRRARTSTRTP